MKNWQFKPFSRFYIRAIFGACLLWSEEQVDEINWIDMRKEKEVLMKSLKLLYNFFFLFIKNFSVCWKCKFLREKRVSENFSNEFCAKSSKIQKKIPQSLNSWSPMDHHGYTSAFAPTYIPPTKSIQKSIILSRKTQPKSIHH